jgi:hypothetical protein
VGMNNALTIHYFVVLAEILLFSLNDAKVFRSRKYVGNTLSQRR